MGLRVNVSSSGVCQITLHHTAPSSSRHVEKWDRIWVCENRLWFCSNKAAGARYFRAKRGNLQGVYGHLPESQGQDLALAALILPSSLNSGSLLYGPAAPSLAENNTGRTRGRGVPSMLAPPPHDMTCQRRFNLSLGTTGVRYQPASQNAVERIWHT